MQNAIIQKIRNDYSPKENTERILKGYATSIKALAEDLYAKDTHFIFELIQNAEDNSYDVEIPALRFVLSKNNSLKRTTADYLLTIENNEVGFQEKHVEAICSVGRSTKQKAEGYIGEKGIGFKSVFRVTSCPHIFSKGFHFSLPEKDDLSGLGYIVPTWAKTIPENLDTKITSIQLPLDKSDFPVKKVSNLLKEIAPETILFLNKLKEINITFDFEEKTEILIKKDDANYPLIKLTYLTKNNSKKKTEELLFWVTSQDFIKPSKIIHEKRSNINSRNISIAIPISSKKPETGKLFAYLPVWENTGLPFIINADFLLTSSRESVKEDELWNEWLRNSVAEVYVTALTSCLSETQLLTFEQRKSCYASIPQVSGQKFLEPIIPAIYKKLEQTSCIYIAQTARLALPHTTKIAPKEFWDILVDNKIPSTLQGYTHLVCPSLESYNELLVTIGSSYIEENDIYTCLDDNNWLSSKDKEWFIKLYQYLKNFTFEDNSLESKKIIPIFSDIESKFLLSCNIEQPIYFEQDNESQTMLRNVPKWLQEIVPVAFLEKEFWKYLTSCKDCEEIREWMTKHLQVYSFSKENYCIDIINAFQEKYDSLSPQQIVEATRFITNYTGDDFKGWENIPVVLETGEKIILNDATDLIVVPEHYDNDTGWQHIWVTKTDRQHFSVLSSLYPRETIDKLLIFCNDFIQKYPDPENVLNITFQNGNEYEKELVYSTPRSTSPITITNWRPPSVLKEHTIKTKKISNCLLSFLSEKELTQYKDSTIKYSYYGEKHQYSDSEFLSRLKSCQWLHTQKGFVQPNKAFLPTQEIQEVLGSTVPYFRGNLPKEVTEILGIKDNLTQEMLLETIQNYSSDNNINHKMMVRIYSAIYSKTMFGSAEKVTRLFKQNKLIFIPSAKKYGNWFNIEDTIWEDSQKVLGDDFIYLEKYYPKLKYFFIKILGVKEKPNPEVFAQRWLKIQSDHERSPKERKEIMDTVYRELLPITKRKDETPSWWEDFVNKALFLNQQGEFVSINKVIVPNDGELKRIFSTTDIHFTWRPEKDSFNQWSSFYDAFNIHRISESVHTKLLEENDYIKLDSNTLLTESMVIMLASWLREKDDKHYNTLLQNGTFQKLFNLCETNTNKDIKVIFSMTTAFYHYEVQDNYPVFWDHDNNLLIIDNSKNLSLIKRKISIELAKGLMNNRAYKDLANWIELILGAKNTDRIEENEWPIPREISKLVKEHSELSKNKENNTSEKDTHSEQKKDNRRSTTEGDNENNKKDKNILDDNDSHSKEMGAKDSEISSSNDIQDNSSVNQKSTNARKESTNSSVNIAEEIDKTFNKDGQTTLSEEYEDDEYYNQGIVKKPSRHREKSRNNHKNRIKDEPNTSQRHRETVKSILEPTDPATREYLLNLYSGKCQICNATFPQRNGTPFFLATHIIEKKHARFLDTPANALCLCPLHFAQWRHGTIKADNILEQILSKKTKKEGGDENISLQIELCGKECIISYKEKHIIELQALLTEAMNTDSEK